MKHIKAYKIFENKEEQGHPGFPKNEGKIRDLCEKYQIKRYTINDDLSIDVEGNVFLNYSNLDYLPLNFNRVSRDFNCSGNKNLKSLEGCPKKVGRHFICVYNSLKSLDLCPLEIGGGFNCEHNDIKSLKGFNTDIKGKFYTHDNPIHTILKKFITSDNYLELIDEFNDYSILRGDKIIWDRMKIFCEDFELDYPNIPDLKEHYTIV